MGFQGGGTAQEYVALPMWNIFKLPPTISLDHATMIEPLAVAVHALRQGGPLDGKNILVLGGGTIGNLVAQTAINLIANGKMHLDNLITHRFPFSDYLQAYHTIETANGRYMKVMIDL